jgi:serine/threonine protein phosphatase 1
MEALNEAGFDRNNPEHWLISCGDAFDRGPESEEVLHFLMSLDRKVLIKGNHDQLLDDCCMRELPYSHDFSNGTVRTINDIGGAGEGYPFDECCQRTWNKLAAYRSTLVNYFETENYIFVHSWIPTNVKYEGKMKPWYQDGKTLTYMEDWRNAGSVEWEEAMWGNPFKRWKEGLNKTGKTIVFGHWHCSTGHAMLHEAKVSENESEGTISEFEDNAIWEPFIYDNIIGIDRCTAYTGEVNVLVLEDNFIEDAE